MRRLELRFSRTAFVWLALAICATPAVAQSEAHAGDDFLQRVDARQYADSWSIASDYFRRSVSQADWVRQATQARESLGPVVSRTLKSAEPQKNPPGAPAGEYLLLTYQTKFADSEPARTETLPLIKGADGKWRAVGYFLR